MMEESQQQRSILGFFQGFIYTFILIDVYAETYAYVYADKPIIDRFNQFLFKLKVFTNPLLSHAWAFGMIFVIATMTLAKKDTNYDSNRHFTYPFLTGLLIFVTSIFIPRYFTGLTLTIIYAGTFLSGAILLHISFSNLSKRISQKLKKDVWNVEEESFRQNEKLIETPYSFNLPMQYYFHKRVKRGWINVNPFRGMMVLGVPGSGKTESVIIPFIKQFLAKGFSMIIYDFKYPDLGEIAYYHYLKNKNTRYKKPLANHQFHVINLDDIEHSRRVNPIAAKYIQTLADASETAESIITALKKSDKQEGSQQFFTQSAINFLASCIYFLAKYEGGKYSTLPHVLAFINQPYDRIFNALFSQKELTSLLSPFKSAYDNEAFDQLEGQIGTVKINISRLATKEAFWVFGAEDFDLKISDPPSVVVLANSAATQSTNGAFYSAILMRSIRLINSKNNNPSAIIVDEAPTVYLHKIENLVATARSNKVAVLLGLQEMPQFNAQYGKETASTISSIMGTIFSGAVRNRETLDWLERLFGKVKQTTNGMSIDRTRTNISLNERMDTVIPAAKISNLNAGELVALVSRENTEKYGTYQPNMFHCKVNIDLKRVEEEKKHYPPLPKFYTFGTPQEREKFLERNRDMITEQINNIAP